MKIRYLLISIPLIVLSFCSADKIQDKPLNLIIFIGDGMGTSQVYAAMTTSGYNMTFPSFPVTGFSITYSLNDYITDSAAGGTALSTGEKTNNGMVAMRPDSTIIPTIMELAKKKGLSTGVISTSSIVHATPASFVAHAGSRADYEDIAKFFLNGTADVFIGGGKGSFIARKDSLNLVDDLKKKGYDVVYTTEEMQKSNATHLAGLMADEHMPYIINGRDTAFLANATAKAIEILSKNKKGFVLMVEGSEIDFGGHADNIDIIIGETLDMDRAVSRAYKFAKTNGKTLIVVTADHETGGLSLVDGSVEEKRVVGDFAGADHTAVMIPVFAYGPGAMNFTGIHQNNDLGKRFIDILSLKKNK
jgi:alkaline phosphatase